MCNDSKPVAQASRPSRRRPRRAASSKRLSVTSRATANSRLSGASGPEQEHASQRIDAATALGCKGQPTTSDAVSEGSSDTPPPLLDLLHVEENLRRTVRTVRCRASIRDSCGLLAPVRNHGYNRPHANHPSWKPRTATWEGPSFKGGVIALAPTAVEWRIVTE
jgi:hypothetical protein